jgi:hypothetical protein
MWVTIGCGKERGESRAAHRNAADHRPEEGAGIVGTGPYGDVLNGEQSAKEEITTVPGRSTPDGADVI